MAMISTREMINESFFLSPLIAPAVAMAAETPHMETALASMVANSSSTFILREIQKRKIPHPRNNDYRLYQSE